LELINFSSKVDDLMCDILKMSNM